MKKIITLLSVVAALGVGPSLVAQDTSAGQSTAAPSSQTTNNVLVASNDGDLTQQLQTKFGQDPAFANVQVSVTKGSATVTGSVPAKADKKRAKDLAKSIPGVKHVKDELTVNPSAGNSNHADRNNNPTNASASPASSDNSSTVATSSPTPTNDQTSATSNNPNSQASGTTGAPTTSTAAAAAPASGENASSAPQNAGNAASENNLAGQGAVNGQANAQSGAATTTGSASAAANPLSTQPTVAAGAIGANAGSATPAPPSNGSGDYGGSINDTTTLQKQIQDAMQNEPTLHNDNVNVSVTDSTIELSGAVQNGKEKETARRIASSFAGNRRVKDRMTLAGRSAPATNPNSSSLGNSPASNPANPTSPTNANNPNAQNPSANTPATNGDASPNPR